MNWNFYERPIFLALFRNDPEIVKLLLAHKPDVNAKSIYGHTPLFYAESLPSHS